MARLFQAFQAHYGFDSSPCSPHCGHGKGAVEAKVGMIRRKLFVPGPGVWSLENFNAKLPDPGEYDIAFTATDTKGAQ
ncbi:transposase [Bifidobacterium sp. DSM 109963]|uniref:Transposase n=1 Tax=Bifidobacterium panos TaxID=2675321 RepID=A0ABX1SYL9_9BIFI|nr:transposase [Bifidobacterium sp. DSM 109963]